MGLARYRRKRDFRRTPEPAGGAAKRGRKLSFVIQKHAARRLHYDFRLEWGGVLKSWAVPKGPSVDPREKRLAVHVEDHPLEYGRFQGTIPEGEYGAGKVEIWDRGTWEPDGSPDAGYRNGRLRFRLAGRRLHGTWVLVRMGGRAARESKENWLLIKEKDAQARPARQGEGAEPEAPRLARRRRAAKRPARARSGRPRPATSTTLPEGARAGPLPAFVEPQLATLVAEPPEGADWLHEIKLDGYRVLVRVQDGAASLLTRRGKDWSARFPGVAHAVAGLPVRQALLDGEVVALDARGISDFQTLQNALASNEPEGIVYYAFDLLHLDGRDLRAAPLRERKRVLAALVGGAQEALRYSGEVEGQGSKVYRHACRMALEGIVSKRVEAPYRSGRGHDWLKVKCLQRQEFVIGGFTDPEGARTGLGALLLGVYEPGGALRYSGRVGTGFTERSLAELRRRMARLERKAPAFADPPRGAGARGVHWVQPRLVAEASFSNWTREGLLRHPSFEGLREDKEPRSVRRERREPAAGGQSGARARAHAAARAPARTSARMTGTAADAEVAGVRLSHPDRVLFPGEGLTKLDLARYYERVARWMLPHVAGRPLSLVRCPEGQGRACFFQKHAAGGVPEHLRTVKIAGDAAPYLWLEDVRGLISLVQLGVLEIHTWGCRAEDPEHPDRLTIDLDPGPGTDWAQVLQAAREVRERLAGLHLRSFVKTTGGKGLHVVAPLAPRLSWMDLQALARRLVDAMEQERPERYVVKASKAARAGRIFLDYLRNARGATAVAPYSTRARPGAPVAAPLRWSELRASLQPDRYRVGNLARRLSALGSDPWRELPRLQQAICRGALSAK